MPAAKKKPATKKKGVAAKTPPTAASPEATPAGPDPVIVLGYQLDCKTAEAKALQMDKRSLQAEVHGLQTQLKEQQSWHEAMLRDITRQHKSRAEK